MSTDDRNAMDYERRLARGIGTIWSGRLLLCLVMLAVTPVSGCQQATTCLPIQKPSFQSDVLNGNGLAGVRRMAIVKFENGTSFQGVGPSIQAQLAAAVRSTTGCEVVNFGNQQAGGCDFESVLRGEYPFQVLADAYRNYHADAVMFARITEYNPYAPLTLGITIRVIDSRDASLLIALDTRWSLAEQGVLHEYRRYIATHFPANQSPAIRLSSPALFCRFITERIAAGWR